LASTVALGSGSASEGPAAVFMQPEAAMNSTNPTEQDNAVRTMDGKTPRQKGARLLN
jgi:hypothetical protein